MIVTLAALLLSGQVTSPSSVTLAWDANTEPNISAYLVQQATASKGPYGGEVWVNGSTIKADVQDLAPGKTYYFVVRAVNVAGLYSDFSNELSVTMPAGPLSDLCKPVTGRYAVSIFPTSLQRTGSKGPGSRTRFDYQVASPNSPIVTIIVGVNGTPISRQDGTDLTNSAGQWFAMPESGIYDLTLTGVNQQGCAISISFGQLVVP